MLTLIKLQLLSAVKLEENIFLVLSNLSIYHNKLYCLIFKNFVYQKLNEYRMIFVDIQVSSKNKTINHGWATSLSLVGGPDLLINFFRGPD